MGVPIAATKEHQQQSSQPTNGRRTMCMEIG